MLPALWALRDAYPKANICLVSQAEQGGAFIASSEVLEGTGLVTSFEKLVVSGPRLARWLNRLYLICRMRRVKWDLGIALMPNYPPGNIELFRVLKKYLWYFGCHEVLAPSKIINFQRVAGKLQSLPHAADNMLSSLQHVGVQIPPQQAGKFFMPARQTEARWAKDYATQHTDAQAAGLIAVAVSANRAANIWPVGRYIKVLQSLWLQYRVVPVFFGGSDLKLALDTCFPPDLPHIICAGESIGRVSELARRCLIYLGNDTGLMHVSVAVGLKCVVIASARDAPGAWAPYGEGHRLLRSNVECEGCLLDLCVEHKSKCMTMITVKEVTRACESLLEQTLRNSDVL